MSQFTASLFIPTTIPTIHTRKIHLGQSQLPFIAINCRSVTKFKCFAQSPLTSQDEIEGLNKEYCDDFVCTSSPAVEATVRSMARDIQRANGVYTRSIISRNVSYSDLFRRFSGTEGYSRMNFTTKFVQNPSVKVLKMRMIDSATAEITWNITGSVGPMPINVDMTTTITMNLLTGQIEKHSDSWSLKKCSPPAAIAFIAARAAWSLGAGSAEAAATTGSILDSLTSMDEENESFTMPNPNDPMKFFQQKDTFKDDATVFVGFLLLMYVMTQAWTQLFKG